MSMPLHPNQLRAGDRVRDFRVVRRLGVGGFAFTFLVERAGIPLSLKMAAQPPSEEDEDRVDDWMRREVASLEYLNHPHVLPVLEWGRWPDSEKGYGYFVTPYVSGSTFHAWRWHERAPLHRSVGVLCDVLKTMEALHARGVCHRDIKAENLLVRREDDKPFLIDFGAVHLPWARPLTEGLAPGTLYCQPPEAITFLLREAARPGSRLEARPTADLYAFGALLYETLTNCRPFSTQLTLEQLLIAIATTMPLDAGQLAPEAPSSLCDLAQRLLAKEPEQRPPSARAVREELERLRREEGHTDPWQAQAKRPSELARVRESFTGVDMLKEPPEEPSEPSPSAPAPEKTPPIEASAVERARWTRRGSRYLVALALGLGLLGLGWTLLREPTAAAPAPTEKGTQSVPSPSPDEAPTPTSHSTQAPSRRCALLTSLLGVAAAQLAGCATAPVRPDPIGYLASCSPEARATPARLDIKPDEQGSFLETGTPVSDESIEDGGALNLKPGPVTASMFVEMKGQKLYLKITGEAVTTPHRVYIQFDRLYLPDGTPHSICGVAVDGIHQYGIPTYARLPMEGAKVDPARVDKSPGSVVLNDPRFETVLQGPEGYYVPRISLAPPDWR
ncbi:MAG TPA: serine/threonine-protein kinase [Archangium sp.]|jgi:serine/threonine-protein kinase|uniref:serine/threonine protein kinase n=1 Tax=Archangium sp. TaxID=1872627 RepID=UPI002ED84491